MPQHKSIRRGLISATELIRRINSAIQEERFHQALELARSLHSSRPTPEHFLLVQQAALGRARQLRQQNYVRDAEAVLNSVLALSDSPEWRSQVAEELAQCGAHQRAAELAEADPAHQAKLRALACDAALGKGKAGRDTLPEDLRPGFDLVLRAFAESEASKDDEARATLQGIGLQSPFLEWKLLLRGLLAYYQRDDARALENWQRLDTERLPFRLAAPLRLGIDAVFREAQKPMARKQLENRAATLQPESSHLRELQRNLSNTGLLNKAFKNATTLVPLWKKEFPHLVPRLASCFYWQIVHHGMPNDVNPYVRLFGAPVDDALLTRMNALALDRCANFVQAHEMWQAYEKEIAKNAPSWPEPSGSLARALLWLHMGQNAVGVENGSSLDDEIFDIPRRKRNLKPGPEDCFRKAIKLAPDLLEAHVALVDYLDANDSSKTEEAAQRLLKQFPTHAPTLEMLGDLCSQHDRAGDAVDYYLQALKVNPLERMLGLKVSSSRCDHAVELALAKQFEQARQEFEASIQNLPEKAQPPLLCKWAAAEFKAGDEARAQELLDRAKSMLTDPRGVAFPMVVESIRFKLRPTLKKAFESEYEEVLNAPARGSIAALWSFWAKIGKSASKPYPKQKVHEKQILGYVEKAGQTKLTEAEWIALIEGVRQLAGVRLQQRMLKTVRRKFPRCAYFILAEAEMHLERSQHFWRAGNLLEKAATLIADLPAGELKDRCQQWHKELQEHFPTDPFEQMFQRFSNMEFMDDDEDDEDYDDDY